MTTNAMKFRQSDASIVGACGPFGEFGPWHLRHSTFAGLSRSALVSVPCTFMPTEAGDAAGALEHPVPRWVFKGGDSETPIASISLTIRLIRLRPQIFK